MKDAAQMSIEIRNQNSMALKALSPIDVKTSELFPLENEEVKDDILDESFNLHLSDDDENKREEKSEQVESNAGPTKCQESEEEILNKFASLTAEGTDNIDAQTEDELLKDNAMLDEKVDKDKVAEESSKSDPTEVESKDNNNLNAAKENQNDSDGNTEKPITTPVPENTQDSKLEENKNETDRKEDEGEKEVNGKENEIEVNEKEVNAELNKTEDAIEEIKKDEIKDIDQENNFDENKTEENIEHKADEPMEVDKVEENKIEVEKKIENESVEKMVVDHIEEKTEENKIEAEKIEEDKGGEKMEEDKREEKMEEDKREEKMEEDKREEKVEEDKREEKHEEEEQAIDEILKDQIMDTEDLLQIVDKDTEENNDKDSCANSPHSLDKAESEDNEVESTEMESEETEEKETVKDEDAVDIDEGAPLNFDNELLDKEYEKLAKSKEIDEEEVNKEENTNVEENDKATESNNQQENMNTEIQRPQIEDTETTKSSIDEAVDKIPEDTCTTSNTEKTEDNKTNDNSEKTKEDVDISEIVNEAKTKETENKVIKEPEEKSTDTEPTIAPIKSGKRSLSDKDDISETKKIKLQEPPNKPEEKEKVTPPKKTSAEEKEPDEKTSKKLVVLNCVSEYMQKKTLTKLTRNDLEELCILKICEAICHKSELGELRHQLGVQEQMIEMWRKEATQLTKQARDLEIVNKRLLHEVRLKNERDKPLIPVKITRSVGLQVRSDSNMVNSIISPKRRVTRSQVTPAPSTTPPTNSPKQINRFPPNRPNTNNLPKLTSATPNTQQTVKLAISKVKISAKPQTSLQPSPAPPPLTAINGVNHSNIIRTTSITQKSTDKAFIDLTDEDDKQPTPSNVNSQQGVRISSSPAKTTGSVTSVNPPRIMYVYNNQLHQGVLQGDPLKPGGQKLMLKLNSNIINPATGVITTVTNGPLVTTGATAVRSTPVQSVRLSNSSNGGRNSVFSKAISKHPAPLPPPPSSQLTIAARKPIPPKPHLSIRRSSGGIVLSWKMPYCLDNYENIASYQLYAYQETSSPPSSDMWRKVGDVKALALPMACTLTQFADGNKYHFAVRAVDIQKRMGPFSDPEQILL